MGNFGLCAVQNIFSAGRSIRLLAFSLMAPTTQKHADIQKPSDVKEGFCLKATLSNWSLGQR